MRGGVENVEVVESAPRNGHRTVNARVTEENEEFEETTPHARN
jgi:hypothetical protein